MPVITRSKTGPTKMTGVKRKFIEILDSDSDSDSDFSDSDCDSVSIESLEDEIDDLKEQLNEAENSNDSLINLLIKEREEVSDLKEELDALKFRHEVLLHNIKELQHTAWLEAVCLTTICVSTIAGMACAYMCGDGSSMFTL